MKINPCKRAFGVTLLAALCVAQVAHAKIPASVRTMVENIFAPALPHRGLTTAQEPLQPNLLHGAVRLLLGAIPAEKADWYITNTKYDYRPTVIDVATEEQTTRRGHVYTYLDRGQIMIISAVEYSGSTIYLKLLSPDAMQRSGGGEAHPSRLAAMVGFKFSDALLNGPADAVITAMQKWLEPFASIESAFAATMPAKKLPQHPRKK